MLNLLWTCRTSGLYLCFWSSMVQALCSTFRFSRLWLCSGINPQPVALLSSDFYTIVLVCALCVHILVLTLSIKLITFVNETRYLFGMVILDLNLEPPLVQAIFRGYFNDIKNLLKENVDINYQDEEKRSPLHAAAFKGDANTTDLLIQKGARINIKDSKWLTPLHRACKSGNEDTVNVLLKYNADTNARDKNWQTPLHVASCNNAYHCAKALLAVSPTVNVSDRTGRTALHHASFNGHCDIVELLIEHGASVNAFDKKDRRALHWASYMGHESVVKILLQSGAEVNVRDKDLYSPLHAAAASGQVFVVQQLLEAGADCNVSNSFGNTPLHTACLNGHELVCQDLISSGTNISAVNLAGQTPIHVSAAATHGEHCLALLIERDANINFQAKDGRTPLHMTAIHGRFMRAQMLLDRGALVDIGDKEGSTALHIAAAHGHELLIGVLLNVGADPSRKGRSGMTPMHLAALSGYVECCRKLLQVRGELDAPDDSGRTCLHLCAFKGNAECLDLLISSGADFNLIDSFGRIPLHYAASQAHFQCVYTLVSVGSSVSLTDLTGATALHYAAAMDIDGKCVEYLLKRKADVSVLDKQGYSVLHYAAAGGQHGALHVLLKHFGIPNYSGYTQGPMYISPLHLAAYKGHKGAVSSLVAIHPDVNITDSSGRTALDLSAQFGHLDCINALIEHGAQPIAQSRTLLTAIHRAAANGRSTCLKQLLLTHLHLVDVRDSHKRTPLMLAVQNGNEGRKACTDILLSYTSEVDLLDNNGRTALHYASYRGFEDCVSSLLDAKAYPYQKDFLGKTPFHLAAASGHVYVLKQLIRQATVSLIDSKLLDNQRYTPLHWAAYKGRENCVEALLGLDSVYSSVGNQFTPLHCAVLQGNELCAAVLLEHLGPSAVEAKDGIGQTAVHVASSRGSADMLLLLLNYGPNLNAQDIHQRTPTMLAAKGHISVLELLLTQCVDLSKRDRDGNTALHYACLASAESAALMLLDRIIEPELIDSPNANLRTPLHIAARNGLVIVTQTLLEKGASVTAIDVNGYNPALSCAPNATVADCLSMIIHIMIDSVNTNGRRSDSLSLSSLNLGSTRKIRNSNVEITPRTVFDEGEDDDHDDLESYSIRSSDSEFY